MADAVVRRRARVAPDAAYAWFTSFEDADLAIQRALQGQRVERKTASELVVERTLDFGEGPFEVRIDVRLRPPRAYEARVHHQRGAFDMTFAFEPAEGGCDVVVTVHDRPGTPASDAAFRGDVVRAVGQNLDDYIPAMERELVHTATRAGMAGHGS